MKKEIHPTSKPTIFVDTSCGAEFFANSTVKSNETRTVDGIEYQVFNVEISSASHPFYTGKQILVDTARRVEKFHEKTAKTKIASETRKGKKVKKAKAKVSADKKEKTAKKVKK
ncbi:MAG: 50S ribosomal protein L31 [Candidatus Magasanikbacteria bacterium RIFCSPHIGHO2_01_FULL_33_34]|uniref:50S ribosomal protein L31 n=1 Tax=Candidatus Magasanikbacteria bacterium RIFCSPHIGHO2_01_FULL_33_34 TaxID=1798671 RepID=A0A1F6LKH5_9BACT|nr:MAG: 50S ribosomal protein L31 [Candidatus Magasanikbacteria bacterium RIFCSPHIGHO2_01_FULL_33_34]OGH65657.1 MAG: 50S ribosomal protein L31 [Candidatus Magasanikbacteria bacterium RIFCSPHIGHO2_02_FULL_33_17]OGH75866.1 MAG: 50S ribosomal protein L31 [Candidatus Magasanikbacteria bacterium RIFCSPLOWO2_01_FULL_33_34]OGH81508.1 MAG: 50S ribosomal protein L31 [Candidatus Magasanikbacteria bacterium RIFCSPLOWO2_12_FULL_34_7]